VLGSDGLFSTGDVRVNSAIGAQHADPALAVLGDGSLVVLWSSYGQDGSMQGVYGQRLDAAGDRLGAEFRVNQFAAYNQRGPAVCALEGGGFAVAWVSEQQSYENSVDVFARRFDSAGIPLGDEFRLNTANNVCATPALSPGWNGGFVAAWSERHLPDLTNMWDVVAGAYDATGSPVAVPAVVHEHRLNSQFSPTIASLGETRLIAWNSLWQDGARDGVYGQLMTASGRAGSEFRINTTTASQQMEPAVAGDGAGRFLVAWSGYVGGGASFEIMGQRYAGVPSLQAPGAPVVSALDSYSLMVSWAPLAGYNDLVGYRLFVDGSASPLLLSSSFHVLGDLDPATVHTFRLAYELTGGRVSPPSGLASGTTWGRDRNHDGLPDDWQTIFWGADTSKWAPPTADSDMDGASNLAEFLAGTDPEDDGSALRIGIEPTAAGFLVQWNAVAGSVYQLQSSGDLRQWADAAGPSYAAGTVAASVIPGNSSTAYYRVIRIR
jgi:hypothetical protein